MSDRRTTPSDGDVDGASPAGMLRVRGTSKLAFGATTAALVTLASGGTAVLVAHGTSTMYGPTALPIGGLLVDSGSGAVVVDRPPGTYGAVPAAPTTEQALSAALAQRAPVGRRTLTVPLVDLNAGTPAPAGGLQVPGVTPQVPSLPAVKPPVVPPVTIPPVVTVPVVVPPVLTPPLVPVVPPVHAPRVPVPAVPVPVPATEPTSKPTSKPTTNPTTKDNSSSQGSGSTSTTSSSKNSDSKAESSGSSKVSTSSVEGSSRDGASSKDSGSKSSKDSGSRDSGSRDSGSKDSGSSKGGSHSGGRSVLRVSALTASDPVILDLRASNEEPAVRTKQGRAGRHAR